MRAFEFYKYQGTGNDFVMIDNRELWFPAQDLALISRLCDRRFGIGADGVILIQNHDEFDFEMVYFNPDGSQSLCGNGSRCAVRFAEYLGLVNEQTEFMAIDGPHFAKISSEEIELQMGDVSSFEQIEDDFLFDTGSPHYIRFTDDLSAKDMVLEGQQIRYNERFEAKGVNVNLIEVLSEKQLAIRTYERGVEAETFSCGTGCTAAALAFALKSDVNEVALKAVGGDLKVRFQREKQAFREIFLIGPAEQVFKGVFSA